MTITVITCIAVTINSCIICSTSASSLAICSFLETHSRKKRRRLLRLSGSVQLRPAAVHTPPCVSIKRKTTTLHRLIRSHMPSTNAHLAILCNALFGGPVCSAAITTQTHILWGGNRQTQILHTPLFPLVIFTLLLLHSNEEKTGCNVPLKKMHSQSWQTYGSKTAPHFSLKLNFNSDICQS